MAGDPQLPLADQVRTWEMVGAFDDNKEAKNISGIACVTPSGEAKRLCLLVSDEKRYARVVTLVDGKIYLGATSEDGKILHEGKVTLFTEGETDAEGVAVDKVSDEEHRYYIVGSHGASKKSHEYQRSRFFLYRFAVDPTTGLPNFPFVSGGPAPGVSRTNVLERVLAAQPLLADRACRKDVPCRPLQDGGVNIEGLAVRDGHLFVGLRAPSTEGAGVILRISMVEVAPFLDEQAPDQLPAATVFRPKLGPSVGIRDMAPIKDGFLLLTGPERPEKDGAESTATVVFWKGSGDDVTPLAALKTVPRDSKPEALLVLGEESDGYRILVLSDGPAGGAPTEYMIRRR